MKGPGFAVLALLPLATAAYAQSERPAGSSRQQCCLTAPAILTRQGSYWVEHLTGKIAAAPRVRIESAAGGIELRGAVVQEIAFRVEKRVPAATEQDARRVLAQYPLRVRRGKEMVELAVGPDRGEGIQTYYTVIVPKYTRAAEVHSRGGNIVVEGIEGSVKASTAGGNMDLNDIGGAVELSTAGGNITLGNIAGAVEASTAGGTIRLASSGADVHAATAGGSIEVKRAGGSVHARTTGGNITIGPTRGDVTAQTTGGNVSVAEARQVTAITAGGSIQVGRARALVRAQTAGGAIWLSECSGPVHAETAAGSILAHILAGREAWADSELETRMGDITVYLPGDLAVTIRAAIEQAADRHRIVSDFPFRLHSASEAPGRREVIGECTLNGGGAPLRLRTASGNIEIRKQP